MPLLRLNSFCRFFKKRIAHGLLLLLIENYWRCSFGKMDHPCSLFYQIEHPRHDDESPKWLYQGSYFVTYLLAWSFSSHHIIMPLNMEFQLPYISSMDFSSYMVAIWFLVWSLNFHYIVIMESLSQHRVELPFSYNMLFVYDVMCDHVLSSVVIYCQV